MGDILRQLVRNSALLRHGGFIDGKWVTAMSGKTFDVTNPANGEVLAKVSDMDTGDTQLAIDAAHKAFQTWKKTTAKERSSLLRNWFNLMEDNKQDLSIILTKESGKPLSEAQGELTYGSNFLEWFAEEAKRVNGEVLQSPASTKEMLLIREPIGVAGLITPWNFPNAMITRKAGAALAAGCTCVIKPAEDTPLSAFAMAELANSAGIPPGVVNVVPASRGNTPAVGELLCTSPKVAGISFTGSTGVGKLLYKQCASGVKKIGLELGGNAPFIVFNSADLDRAIEGLMVAKFRNTGQACISANRIFVQEGVYDQFVEKITTAVRTRLVIGDGLQEGVNFGPIINQSQFSKVSQIVQDSISQGAKLIEGGKPHPNGGLYFEPTILGDVTDSMPCFKEEIFGPVVAIKKFDCEEEVIKMANDSNLGLASYFYSDDVSQVFRVSRSLEYGMVGVNEGLISAAEAAFGGVKESGIGREGSSHGIDEYTDIKYICIGGIN